MRLWFLRLFHEFREMEDLAEHLEGRLIGALDIERMLTVRCEDAEMKLDSLKRMDEVYAEPESEKPAPPKRRTMRDIQRAKVAQTRAANAELLRKRQSKAQEK